MRTIIRLRHITAILSLGFLSNLDCAEKTKVADASLPPAKAEAPVADARWSEIKNLGYDDRGLFLIGFKRLQGRLDEQIGELTAHRAAMKGDANTQDWDFAMKEMGNARSYLTGTGELIGKATSASWNQDRERVSLAWLRTQAAYAKVKASTTL